MYIWRRDKSIARSYTSMHMDILTLALFIVGFVVLIRGAEWLIEGSTVLAKQFGISDLIIGLTVIAFGTSLPELIVNLFASAESSELAIGNIVGSNIANILLILGVAAIIHPLTVHRTTVYREIIFNIGAAGILGVLVAERFLSAGGFKGLDQVDGIILVTYFAIFMYYTFGKVSTKSQSAAEKRKAKKDTINVGTVFLQIAGGIVGLWLGGAWIVDGAVEIATYFGVSEALVGLTIVAIGTSLPELAASVVAVKKGNVDIAVGNAVGSNLFNIFWVLGLGSIVRPIGFSDELVVDIAINGAVALLLFGTMTIGRYRHQISRSEGKVFIAAYIAYLVFAVIRG